MLSTKALDPELVEWILGPVESKENLRSRDYTTITDDAGVRGPAVPGTIENLIFVPPDPSSFLVGDTASGLQNGKLPKGRKKRRRQ